ncbi:hypothetical protein CI610_03030 [invertebrate metagenome]|uniref:Uncharacterized protein n=1 Tax=invertebrate metagenome TaxID=1711999 RepID=A0A2H9T4B0_9ZZZZ
MMRKSRYTEAQIVKILKKVEAGRLVRRSVGNTAFLMLPITTGKPNTAALKRYPAYGFGKLFSLLRRWGYRWNHKSVYIIYCELRLNKQRRSKNVYPVETPNLYAVQR